MKSTSYLLFIDESGRSKMSDGGRYFLLSGLVINKDLHTALSSYMLSLKEKSNIPTTENIHAFDLFEGERRKLIDSSGKVLKTKKGNNKHKQIPFNNINTFFDRLISLIEGADMHTCILKVDKKHYLNLIINLARKHKAQEKWIHDFIKRKRLNDFLYEALVRRMVLEFGHFLEEEDAQGEVVAESRREDDEGVLKGFITATKESTFSSKSKYRSWAKSSRKRIHSLTFQNKKGLSFGLEIADLFSWAHFNKTHGRAFPLSSKTQINRVESRIKRASDIAESIGRKAPETMSQSKIISVAFDRVSEFTEALDEYRNPSVYSGTPPGNPGRP